VTYSNYINSLNPMDNGKGEGAAVQEETIFDSEEESCGGSKD